MLFALAVLCAQTPVQHQLDMLSFEHITNYNREAEKYTESIWL
ncbi:MAG: hypothetical protein QM477_11370 [Planctomycetota bacterium]